MTFWVEPETLHHILAGPLVWYTPDFFDRTQEVGDSIQLFVWNQERYILKDISGSQV